MERTPSPSRRLHTPPAPFHGNNYEPYSPRRSTRVAAQLNGHLHSLRETGETIRTSPRMRRDVTPTASSKRRATTRINNFTLSPPSSPVSSPQQHQRSPRTTRRAINTTLDSEPEPAAPTPARRLIASQLPGMLPTPSETPRKRPLLTEASLKTTSRILFPSRHANVEEATPKKARKNKNVFTLDEYAQDSTEQSSSKIQIFTDSKERIPSKDDDEDNPFLVSKGKGKAKAKATSQRSQRLDARSAQMKEATDRDEGMVFFFRGRKLFRKFKEGGPSSDQSVPEDDSDLPIDEKILRRQIGTEARRPLTRSSIKPRLLFKEEIKERNRKNGEASDDEEADTEIEAEIAATPSHRKGKAVIPSLETTPPPTVRKPAKREVSFESWSRVKSAHFSSGSTPGSKKRSGETLERDASKRARSEHSTSSMSLD